MRLRPIVMTTVTTVLGLTPMAMGVGRGADLRAPLAIAVIGGLIRTNESTVDTGVPYLKDIPVVGHLFKSSNKVEEERELLIFVTPRIIWPKA